jgi:archaellum biogenesis ATPase FlaH
MFDIRSRKLFPYLLLAAVCFSFLSIQNASSQSAVVTTTTTINQPASGQCNEIWFAFSGKTGTEITGTYGSDTAIDFYILTPGDFAVIQKDPKCGLLSTANPIYSALDQVGHDHPYRSRPFPVTGTYYFVFVLGAGLGGQLVSGHANVELVYPASFVVTGMGPAATSTSSMSSVAVTTSQQIIQSTAQVTTSQSSGLPLGTLGIVGVIVAVALIGSVMAFMRRGKSQAGSKKAPVKQEVVKPEVKPEVKSEVTPEGPHVKVAQNITTGYDELDSLLAGGLPVGFAILIVSPPCDERDLLFKKIIESALSMGSSVCFLSRDLSRTQDFAGRYQKNFYVFSPQAEKIALGGASVFKIQGVQNLSDLNISFTKGVETLPKTGSGRVLIIDLLSDVLLDHKALMTRKWLDDFIGKRKTEGFTILGVLNPLISSKQETQTIMDLFDGIIEIYERELRERARRFLIVKKMYGRKYVETELMLDKDKLF